MELKFNYLKIKKIAEAIKKTKKIALNGLVEIVPYIFTDDEVLSIFIREGAGLKDNAEADAWICEKMEDGIDLFDIQTGIVKDLINANFYAKDLQKILDEIENGPAKSEK